MERGEDLRWEKQYMDTYRELQSHKGNISVL